MQEVLANMLLMMDRSDDVALTIRAECRQQRGDLYGALKGHKQLQSLGCTVSMVRGQEHTLTAHTVEHTPATGCISDVLNSRSTLPPMPYSDNATMASLLWTIVLQALVPSPC